MSGVAPGEARVRVVVQKYGGSSVADLERLRAVAARVAKTRAEGLCVVVVVSAMGNTTNELIALARQVSARPDRRELDMLISVGERIAMALLAMALREIGVPAVSLTGSQSGIVTDEAHADARVVEVRPDRVRATLEAGNVAIIAGFQGMSRAREVTTLGRGGSDTTAVVLAAALNAEHCEICSDVDGVWSADPRVVPEALKLDGLSLDQALELGRGGAKVLYEDAVRYARDRGVAIHASSTFGVGSGTRLDVRGPADAIAVTGDAQLVRVRITGDVAAVGDAIRAAGGRVRRTVGERAWVDVRNAHGGLGVLPGAEVEGPAAVVTAVGSALGEDLGRIGRVDAAIRAAGIAIRASAAAGDAAWWDVPAADLDRATAVVHGVLV
jgi:aspartate kinase